MSEKINVGLDGSEGDAILDALEKRRDEITTKTVELVDMTEKSAKVSFNKVLSAARLSWSALDQVFQALGINLGEQLRLFIQAGFSTISALQAIYMAEASNPFTAAAGLFSLTELEFAIISLILAQSGQRELATKTAQTARAIFSVGNVINGISFLR